MTELDTRSLKASLLSVAMAGAGEDLPALWKAVSDALDAVALSAYAAAPLASMTQEERDSYAIRLQVWRGASMRSFREMLERPR